MKNNIKLVAMAVAVLGLGACESMSMGNVDMEPPYAVDRTASHSDSARVATVKETTVTTECPSCSAPVQCESVDEWKARAMRAERDLAQCMEASKRVQSTYQESLRK